MKRRKISTGVTRAGLKPMQPMQLHWAPRLWGPAPWCLGRLFIFAGYTLCLRIQYKRHINYIVNNERPRQNEQISSRTLANVLNSHVSALGYCISALYLDRNTVD